MPFVETDLKDLLIFEPKIFKDDRGYFFESFNKKVFTEQGINSNFVQDNQSLSTYGTLRGLHFQTGDAAQAKLVRVLEGKVLDVIVDLRSNSKTYGKHVSVELSSQNQKQLYIPRGFAHGFVVLSAQAIFFYKCDNFYSKKDEGGLIYNDPELAIDWKLDPNDIILSDKDKILPRFRDYKDPL